MNLQQQVFEGFDTSIQLGRLRCIVLCYCITMPNRTTVTRRLAMKIVLLLFTIFQCTLAMLDPIKYQGGIKKIDFPL